MKGQATHGMVAGRGRPKSREHERFANESALPGLGRRARTQVTTSCMPNRNAAPLDPTTPLAVDQATRAAQSRATEDRCQCDRVVVLVSEIERWVESAPLARPPEAGLRVRALGILLARGNPNDLSIRRFGASAVWSAATRWSTSQMGKCWSRRCTPSSRRVGDSMWIAGSRCPARECGSP